MSINSRDNNPDSLERITITIGNHFMWDPSHNQILQSNPSNLCTTEYSSIGNMRKNPSCKGRTRDLARINHARDARRIPYFPCAIVAPSEVFVVVLLLACLVAIAAATQPRGGRWRLWVGGWLAVEGPSTVGVLDLSPPLDATCHTPLTRGYFIIP